MPPPPAVSPTHSSAASARSVSARSSRFPPARISGLLGAAWGTPSVFWFVGGTDPARFAAAMAAGKLDELPGNHAPDFAPVIHPTLQTGIEAMTAAAEAWLAPRPEESADRGRDILSCDDVADPAGP